MLLLSNRLKRRLYIANICESKLFDFLPFGSHVDADGHVLRGFSHELAEAEATLVPSWLVFPYLV